MSSSNVSSVIKYFAQANEGFTTTLQSTIAPAATTVGLASVAGLTNATVFVGIIEPGGANQQVFTGTVDTVGSQITGVVWTRGSNVTHNSGVTIVDYTTGTLINMITTGILKFANQSAQLIPTSLYDVNGNKTLDLPATASAVNRLSLNNQATTNPPQIAAVGTDTNIGINLVTKGTDTAGTAGELKYNGVGYRVKPRDWVRDLSALTFTSTPVAVWSIITGTGWTYPNGNPGIIASDGTQHGEIRYKRYLDAGTYTFTHWFGTGADHGQVTWGLIDESGTVTTIGGANVLDTYNASVLSATTTASGVNISAGGYYTMFIKTDAKNASSTSYKLWYFGSQLWRTA